MLHLRRLRFAPLVGSVLVAAACSQDRPPRGPNDDVETAAPAASEAPEPAPEQAPVDPSEPPVVPPQTQEPASSEPRDTRGKEQIQQVIVANRQKVRACYDAALKTNPGLQGDLVVSFVIDPDGDVKHAEVNWSESDLHIPELDACTVDAVRTFKFPASSRGLESKVNYPYNFNPPPPEIPAAKR